MNSMDVRQIIERVAPIKKISVQVDRVAPLADVLLR